MPIGSLFAIYFILWWLCLFFVLPFGVRSQVETGEVIEGTEPGAPRKVNFKKIVLTNTVLSAIVMVLVLWALSNPVLQEYWR